MATAGDAESGLRAFKQHGSDLVVLEAALPGKSGYEVVREIREESDVPVVMLTAEGDGADEVRGFEMGADACVAKPISHLAFLARVKAVLRRTHMPPPARTKRSLVFGDLVVDLQKRRVTMAEEPIKFTPVEYRLLCYLARHAGGVVSHRTLLNHIWGLERTATTAHLKVFISRVRAKIERAGVPSHIETVRGFGYRFIEEGERT